MNEYQVKAIKELNNLRELNNSKYKLTTYREVLNLRWKMLLLKKGVTGMKVTVI